LFSAPVSDRAVANLQYFINNYDLEALQPYINKNLKEVTDSIGKIKRYRESDFISDRYELRSSKLEWAKKYLGLGKFESYNYLYTG